MLRGEMDIGRGLPRFGVRGFMENVAKGAQERSKIEEWERRERERLDEQKRRKREAWREMWTTPGLRPLAEPPILDWDYFFRRRIPSDLRYKALFPSDPEERAAFKDLEGENAALSEYGTWVLAIRDDPTVDNARNEFYNNLYADQYADWKKVNEDYVATFNMATGLCRFEYECLDNDGKTTRLENWVKRGANIFLYREEEVSRKYQYLVPPDFVEDPLATFEFFWLKDDGGNDHIRSGMEEGNDILVGWPQEVQDKYGHLRSWLPAVTQNSSQGSSSQAGSDQPEYSGKDEDEGEDERGQEEESNTDGSADADDELSGCESDNYETAVKGEA